MGSIKNCVWQNKNLFFLLLWLQIQIIEKKHIHSNGKSTLSIKGSLSITYHLLNRTNSTTNIECVENKLYACIQNILHPYNIFVHSQK